MRNLIGSSRPTNTIVDAGRANPRKSDGLPDGLPLREIPTSGRGDAGRSNPWWCEAPKGMHGMSATIELAADERVNWVTSSVYISIHFVPLLAFVTGVTWASVALCVGLYFGRMFCLTGGYHRYFSHRTYKTSRAFQFVLALCGTTARAEGPAVVGRAPPPPPPPLRHARRTSTRRADGLLVVARRLDPVAPSTTATRPRTRSRTSPLPRAALARPLPLGAAGSCWRWRAVPDRRLERRWSWGFVVSHRAAAGTARSRSTRCRTCSAAAATRPTTTAATTWCSR